MKTSVSRGRILLFAAALGLTAGIAEGITGWIFSIVRVGRGWPIGSMPEILWMAPLLNTLAFAAIGAILVLASGFSEVLARRAELVARAVFGFLVTYAPLAASERIHSVAAILIGLGVAVRLSHRGQVLPPTPRLRRALLGLACAGAVLILVGLASGVPRTVSATSHASPAPSAKPNVLLIVLDTLRATQLSSYGYSRRTTPNLDQLAREGVLFEKAFSTAPLTLASHATMFTGRYSFDHRISPDTALAGDYLTLPEYLYARGFETAGFTANIQNLAVPTGLAQGFATYDDSTFLSEASDTAYGKLLAALLPRLGYYDQPGRKDAEEVGGEFLRWLESNPNRPFFAFLNYFDVHDPYLPPRDYQRRYSNRPTRGDRINGILFPKDHLRREPLSEQEVAEEIAAYDASLAYLDDQLGALFNKLAALGVLDQTVVIVTSDHGESFGNHGQFGHGRSLYHDLIHVPLIIRYPSKIPEGLRINHVVSLQSIPATVLDVVGLRAHSPFSGTSFVDHWALASSGSSCRDDPAFAEARRGRTKPSFPRGQNGDVKSLSTERWHLILYEEGDIELFDFERDPLERNNLASTPEGEEVISRLRPVFGKLLPAEDWKVFEGILMRRERPRQHVAPRTRSSLSPVSRQTSVSEG